MGNAYYILVFSALVLLTVAVIVGWIWAVRSGQMRKLNEGARIIFDDDEPVGEMTDAFPGEARRDSQGRKVDIPEETPRT